MGKSGAVQQVEQGCGKRSVHRLAPLAPAREFFSTLPGGGVHLPKVFLDHSWTPKGPRTNPDLSDPTPNGPGTDPERSPNGPRADPAWTPYAPRTDLERTPRRPRTDHERTPNEPRTDPERTPNGSRRDPKRTTNQIPESVPMRD